MAQAALLSQIEGLLEQFTEDYPEDAARVEGLMGETKALLEEFRAGGGSEEPMEEAMEEEEPRERPTESFKDFASAKDAAMKTADRTGNFRGEKEPKAEPEEEGEEQAPPFKEKKKKRSKAY